MSTVRYKESVEPVYTDGRDIDLQLAELTARQRNRKPPARRQNISRRKRNVGAASRAAPTDQAYYDRPMLNESVWMCAIPTYYYVGGLGGGALVLGAAVQCKSDGNFRRLIKRCHWIGFIGCCVSGALLVYDPGRPSRFINKLRVFRPTSLRP